VEYAGTQCSLHNCSSHITQESRRSTANILRFSLQNLKESLSSQSVKLNSTNNEATHFVTDIRSEERLGGQSAESSELLREESFDYFDIYKKSSSRNNIMSGNTKACSRETMFRYQTCVRSFTHQSSEVKGFRLNEKRFSCDVCKKRFTNRNHLDTHTRVHTGERTFSCEICKKQFTRRSGLKTHIRLHSGERPFSCKVCNKKFTLSSYLARHLKVHSGEKRFLCEVCKKNVSTRSNLIMYLRIHSGEILFNFEVCKRKFT
jgi:hypothetical protein